MGQNPVPPDELLETHWKVGNLPEGPYPNNRFWPTANQDKTDALIRKAARGRWRCGFWAQTFLCSVSQELLQSRPRRSGKACFGTWVYQEVCGDKGVLFCDFYIFLCYSPAFWGFCWLFFSPHEHVVVLVGWTRVTQLALTRPFSIEPLSSTWHSWHMLLLLHGSRA